MDITRTKKELCTHEVELWSSIYGQFRDVIEGTHSSERRHLTNET